MDLFWAGPEIYKFRMCVIAVGDFGMEDKGKI